SRNAQVAKAEAARAAVRSCEKTPNEGESRAAAARRTRPPQAPRARSRDTAATRRPAESTRAKVVPGAEGRPFSSRPGVVSRHRVFGPVEPRSFDCRGGRHDVALERNDGSLRSTRA